MYKENNNKDSIVEKRHVQESIVIENNNDKPSESYTKELFDGDVNKENNKHNNMEEIKNKESNVKEVKKDINEDIRKDNFNNEKYKNKIDDKEEHKKTNRNTSYNVENNNNYNLINNEENYKMKFEEEKNHNLIKAENEQQKNINNLETQSKIYKEKKLQKTGNEKNLNIQLEALKNRQVIVGTPGRLSDLIKTNTRLFSKLRYLILDESDKLLSLGFAPTIERLTSYLPKQRTTALFTATLDDSLKKLGRLTLRNPKIITTDSIPRGLFMSYVVVKPFMKIECLCSFLKRGRCVVFFSTCAAVDYFHSLFTRIFDKDYNEIIKCYKYEQNFSKIKNNIIIENNHELMNNIIMENDCELKNNISMENNNYFVEKNIIENDLIRNNIKDITMLKDDRNYKNSSYNIPITNSTPKKLIFYKIHGKICNEERLKVYKNFYRDGNALFCTDVAARGIDFKDVEYVIHFDMPLDPANFVHRSGRTARNGSLGVSVLFLMPNELPFIEYLKIKGFGVELRDDMKQDNIECTKEYNQEYNKVSKYSGQKHNAEEWKDSYNKPFNYNGQNKDCVEIGNAGTYINENSKIDIFNNHDLEIDKNLGAEKSCELNILKQIDTKNKIDDIKYKLNCNEKQFVDNKTEDTITDNNKSNIFYKKQEYIIHNTTGDNIIKYNLSNTDDEQCKYKTSDVNSLQNSDSKNADRMSYFSDHLNYSSIKNLFDQDLCRMSLIAFISYIRSYKEYSLSFIFRLKEIDFDSTIALFFLEKVPQMNELNHVVFKRFKRPEKRKDRKGKKVKVKRINKKTEKQQKKKMGIKFDKKK